MMTSEISRVIVQGSNSIGRGELADCEGCFPRWVPGTQSTRLPDSKGQWHTGRGVLCVSAPHPHPLTSFLWVGMLLCEETKALGWRESG